MQLDFEFEITIKKNIKLIIFEIIWSMQKVSNKAIIRALLSDFIKKLF